MYPEDDFDISKETLRRPNVLEHIRTTDHLHFLKIKDPFFKYQIIHEPVRTPGDTDFIYHLPNLVGYGEKGKIHINGSVILATINFPYFHNILETFPLILEAHNLDNNITVVLNGNDLSVNPESNDFYGMNNDYQTERRDRIDYVKEFLDYYNIKYVCINSNEHSSVSADIAYVAMTTTNPVNIGSRRAWESQIYYLDPKTKMNFVQCQINHLGYNLIKANLNILDKYLPKINLNRERKIYISRGKAVRDKTELESEIEIYFESQGYEIIYFEDYSFFDQIKIAKSAYNIVSRHGSGLVNILLNQDIIKITELHLSDIDSPESIPMPYSRMFRSDNIYNSIIIPGKNKESLISNLDSQFKYLNKYKWPGEEYFGL